MRKLTGAGGAGGGREHAEVRRVVREKQRPLFRELPDSPLPPLALLDDPPTRRPSAPKHRVHLAADRAQAGDFGVAVKVLAAYPGQDDHPLRDPTRMGRQGRADPPPGQGSRPRAVGDSIRVVETIPGSVYMGLELPNPKRQIVKLIEILSSTTYNDNASPLTLVLGKEHHEQAGDRRPDQDAAPAGRRHHQSGKSVAVNAMILSLLYKASRGRSWCWSTQMLELSVYEGIRTSSRPSSPT